MSIIDVLKVAAPETVLAGLRVLVVDDEESIRFGLTKLLEARGARVESAGSLARAVAQVDRFRPDVVLLDLRLPDAEGLSGLGALREKRPEARIVMMTAFGSIETAVEAIRAGAEDFVTKPVATDHLDHVLGRIGQSLRLESENLALRREVDRAELFWGDSPAIARLLEEARRAAASDALLVLTGESGTGKGALARQIHAWSARREAPFVNVNCAGLSRELLESELFGHEKGSFTGASGAKQGLFEIAHLGTLFLDEVAEIDMSLQPRLLKAIEEKQFHRVGGVAERTVDCRVIAATNRDLAAEVAGGRFRADFYYRLNVLTLRLPALRERPADIPDLAGRFLAEFDSRAGRKARRFDAAAERLIAAYAWPGNIRELRNFAERLSILAGEDVIRAATVARFLGILREAGSRLPTLEEKEREYIDEVIRLTGGNKSAAAEILGITRNTLYAKIRADEPAADPAAGET